MRIVERSFGIAGRGRLGACIVAVGLATLATAGASARDGEADSATGAREERLGAWSEPGGTRCVLLEADRAAWWSEGQPRFFRATYDESGVDLEAWGGVRRFTLELKDGTLHMKGDGESWVLERLDETPEVLRVPAYDLPEDVEIPAELAEALTEDLAARRAEDQRVRQGAPGTQDPGEMARVDRENTEFLRDVIHELGWIDAERFGPRASEAAFLIVQHTTDLRLMRTALPGIEADARAGRVSKQSYALLHDRFHLNLGYLQRYGSQIGTRDGTSLLMPCEDIARVDELRAEMGMGPLGEYLDYFRNEGDPPIPHLGDGEYVRGG